MPSITVQKIYVRNITEMEGWGRRHAYKGIVVVLTMDSD